jgi:hypothetical protein
MSNNSSLVEHDDDLDYILLSRLIVWGYVGMVLSIFGIIGNVITVLVLISPSMRTTSTNIYLTALSCSNILFLLIFIPTYSMRYLFGYELYRTNQPPFAFEILLTRLPTTPIYNTILLSIIYLTIAVSTDRLILIKFPLKAKRILTPRVTLVAILFIYMFSIVYCIPYWLEQRYVPELKQCRLTTIGKRIHRLIRIYIYIPVVYLIPFVTLTCINITILLNLIAKKHITMMLVIVIILFVLSQFPLLILNAWHTIDPLGSSQSVLFHSLNSIGVLLIVVNTSTNFLVYCFFGQKFRQTLVHLLCGLVPRQAKRQSQQQVPARKSFAPTTNAAASSTRLPASSTVNQTPSLTPIDEYKVPIVPAAKCESPAVKHESRVISVVETNICNEESSPLLMKIEPVPIENQVIPLKNDHRPNVYTCANGKRILVVRI